MLKKTGGGAFDPKERNCYFIAGGVSDYQHAIEAHKHILIPVDALNDGGAIETINRWMGEGVKVFIDSGIYNLTITHARNHNMHMDEALGLAPSEIEGFEKLLDKYRNIISRFGKDLWGYIELDLGGQDNKRKTRAMLEGQGFAPIPVYHPLVDNWEYFDELASQYDRICFGNIVYAPAAIRKRLLATAWERKKLYPNLWIHLLGLTPNQWLNAYPINSADSSSWLSATRWGGYKPRAILQALGQMHKNYRYVLGSDANAPEGYHRAKMMAGIGSAFLQRNWRNHLDALEAIGFNPRGSDEGTQA